MTEMIKSRIREAGGSDKAGAEVLFSLAREEDNFHKYANTSDQSEENTYETLLNERYEDIEAKEDLKNAFEEILNNERENQDFQ